MSKRKPGRMSDYWSERAVKDAYGPTRYGKADEPARRMKCSHCPRTRPFHWKLIHTVCPACKTGRWQ